MKDLRADRLATLYLFRPFKRWIPDRGVTIPILMYHSISDSKENRHPYYRTCTAPMVFREQLKTLRDSGYESIGLSEAISMLSKKGAESKKRVVITFDDGYEDFYSQAFPLLAEYRYSATVFLPTAYIGEDRLRFNNYEC